jgi:hypothetical protein
MNKVSGIAPLIVLVTGLGLNISNIIDLIDDWLLARFSPSDRC